MKFTPRNIIIILFWSDKIISSGWGSRFKSLESKNTASWIKGILNCNPGSVITFLGSPNCNTIACLVSFTIKNAPVKVRKPIKTTKTTIIFFKLNLINYYFLFLIHLMEDMEQHLDLQHHQELFCFHLQELLLMFLNIFFVL